VQTVGPELDRSLPTLITGAGGFIGGHLVGWLRTQGFERVRAVDVKPPQRWYQHHPDVEELQLDLSTLDGCRKAVDGMGYVFNFAADMGGMGFISTQRAQCMLTVLTTSHLLIAANDARVNRYFYASSACVYPDYKQDVSDVRALREEDAYPAMPEDGYGWEKLFGERLARHFSEDFGLHTRVARYHNVYGPQGTYDGGREKAPAAICRKVAQAQLSGIPEIEIWGDGEQTRSFMYIDDCLEGTMRLFASDYSDPLNIGSSELVTINEMVSICERIAGVTLRRTYVLDAPQGVRGRNSDNTTISAQLGWEPSIPLAEGLETTYRWIYDQLASGKQNQRIDALASM
jgi:GDP-D-mannose 3', 5'-epimerase